MNTPTALDFDFPAFPAPSRVSTSIAVMRPLTMKECDLARKRLNGTITDDERRELATLLESLAAEDAERERRELHPSRKVNFHD